MYASLDLNELMQNSVSPVVFECCSASFALKSFILPKPGQFRENYIFQRTHDEIISSHYVKMMLRRRFDVIMNLLLRHVSAMRSLNWVG